MRGRSWRLGRIVVAVAFVAVAAVLVGTFTATRSASARAVRLHQGRSRFRQGQGRNSNEGPDGSYAAQVEAQRAYPADTVPFEATENSISTFNALKANGKGPAPGRRSARPRPSTRPCSTSSSPAGRSTPPPAASPHSRSRGCKKNGACKLYLGAAGGGVWRTDMAQGHGQHELDVRLGLLRDERDRLAARRSERSERQHGLRRHRRAERLR